MKRILSLIIAVNILAVPTANAAASDEDIQQLREQTRCAVANDSTSLLRKMPSSERHRSR